MNAFRFVVATILSATAAASPARLIESTKAVREAINESVAKNHPDRLAVELSLETVRRSETRLNSLWVAASETKANNRPAMLDQLKAHQATMQRLLADAFGTHGMARPALRKLVAEAEVEWSHYSKRVAGGDYP